MRKCQSLVWLNFISGLQFIKEQNIVNKSTSVFNAQVYDKSSNLQTFTSKWESGWTLRVVLEQYCFRAKICMKFGSITGIEYRFRGHLVSNHQNLELLGPKREFWTTRVTKINARKQLQLISFNISKYRSKNTLFIWISYRVNVNTPFCIFHISVWRVAPLHDSRSPQSGLQVYKYFE